MPKPHLPLILFFCLVYPTFGTFNCNSECLTCSSADPSICKSCIYPSFLSSNTCKCNDGYYITGGWSPCTACANSCKTCAGSSKNCTSCSSSAFLYQNKCYQSCASSSYFNTTSLTCKSCDSSCLTCNGGSAQNCTSCASGTLVSGSCQCSAGKFKNTASTCQNCDNMCGGCSGSSTYCTTCKNNLILSPSNTCICNTGTYLDSTTSGNYSCKACDGSCKTCAVSSTNCTSCPSNSFLYKNRCYQNCASSSYFNTASLTCQSCDPNCLTCNGGSAQNCTSCTSGTLLNGACQCGAGKFKDTAYTCQNCDNMCGKCSGFSVSCTACKNNLVLSSNNTCICNLGSYLDFATSSDYSCKACDSTCKECSGPGSQNCTACETGKTLINGECVITSDCSQNCRSCTGPSGTDCTACFNGFAFLEVSNAKGKCLSQCPTLYYIIKSAEGNVCKPKIEIDNQMVHGRTSNEVEIILYGYQGSGIETIISNITFALTYTQSQPPITYTYSYDITVGQNYIFVKFSFIGHLLPGNILTAYFKDFRDDNTAQYYLKNQIQTLVLDEIYEYSSSVQAAINITSQVGVAAKKANSVLSWGSSLIVSNVHSMRSQIVEEMLAYFIYMDIRFPPNFVAYELNNQTPLTFFIPNFMNTLIQKLQSIDSSLSWDSLATKNIDLGFALNRYAPDRYFLVNFGSTISIILVVLFGLLILTATQRICWKFLNAKSSPFKRICKILINYFSYTFQWNFLINQYISSYMDLLFNSLLQITNGSPHGIIDYIQYISSVFGFIFSCLGIFLILFLCRRIHKTVASEKTLSKDTSSEKSEDFLKRLELLHEPFHTNRFHHLLYPFALLVRSFFFVIVIFALRSIPLLQILYAFFSTIAVIAYLIHYKPLKPRLQLVLTLIYEILFLFACIGAIALQVYNQKHLADITTRSSLGFFLVACGISMSVLDVISVLIEVIRVMKDLRLRFRKKRLKKLVSPINAHSVDISSALSQLGSPKAQGESTRCEESSPSPLLLSPLSRLVEKRKIQFSRAIPISENESPRSIDNSPEESTCDLYKRKSKETTIVVRRRLVNDSIDLSPSLIFPSTRRTNISQNRHIYNFDEEKQEKNASRSRTVIVPETKPVDPPRSMTRIFQGTIKLEACPGNEGPEKQSLNIRTSPKTLSQIFLPKTNLQSDQL